MTTTLHAGTTFLVSGDDGQVASGTDGLYFQDARFLSRLELLLDGHAPVPLTVLQPSARDSVGVATNPELAGAPRGKLEIQRRRHLSHDSLTEEIAIRNYGDRPARFTLSLALAADFDNIFTVKTRGQEGGRARREGQIGVRGESGCAFWYGAPDRRLVTRIDLSRDGAPTGIAVELPRHGVWKLKVAVKPRIEGHPRSPAPTPAPPLDASAHARRLRDAAPTLETDHEVLRDAYRTAAEDIVALRAKGAETEAYEIAAGIPWYMALFGRDSLITSFQTMLHDPSIARGTLRALARLQGSRVERETLEEPGRILHEHRTGLAIAARQPVPPYPHYGTIDAPALFLIVIAEYARVTGDLGLVRELWDNVERALRWILEWGDRDGDGFVEYDPGAHGSLHNLAWKDSDGSMRFRNGAVAEPSIAPVEVQGYGVDAFRRVGELMDALQRPGGDDLRARADRLARAVGERYWLDERGTFAEALDGKKRRVDALTSNPGHLLWSGAVPDDRAARVAAALLSPELFSGFGVRTMGKGEGGFSPISYHCGSVWPHDNSLILAGLARYRLDEQVRTLASGLLASLACYPHRRWPELFAGYDRDAFARPVAYAGANSPQAWATGAVMLLVRTLLGLSVDATHRTIRLRPIAIDGLTFLRLRGLPVAGGRADVEVRFAAGAPKVSIVGLPHGWNWLHEADGVANARRAPRRIADGNGRRSRREVETGRRRRHRRVRGRGASGGGQVRKSGGARRPDRARPSRPGRRAARGGSGRRQRPRRPVRRHGRRAGGGRGRTNRTRARPDRRLGEQRHRDRVR
jgi:glycogen debranching enzyme